MIKKSSYLKICFVIFLILGISFPPVSRIAKASNPTYYVSVINGQLKYRLDNWPDGSNGTIPNPSDLNQLFFDLNNDKSIVLDAGTYSGTLLDATDGIDIGRSGQHIRSAVSTDPDYANRLGEVIIDGAGMNDDVFVLNASNNISGITIRGADGGKRNLVISSGTAIINDMILSGGDSGFLFSGSSNVTLNRVKVSNVSSYIGDVNGASANTTFNYGQFTDNASPIRVFNGNLTVNNSTLAGTKNEAIYIANNNGQQVMVNNSIITASSTDNANKYAILNSSSNASCTVNNTLIHSNPMNGNYLTSGCTLNNATTDEAAGFISPKRQGMVSIVIDDAASKDWFGTMADLAEERNFRLTWAVDTRYMSIHEYWGSAIDFANRGHEIASHSSSHSYLTELRGINIQYIGTGAAATLSIDAATKTLTTSVADKPSDNLSINLNNYTLHGLANFIASSKGGSAYVGTIASSNNNEVPASILSTVSNQSIKESIYIANLNADAYYSYEIQGSKTAIETQIGNGYVVKSLHYPFWQSNSNVRDAVSSAGYIGARGFDGTRLISDIAAFETYGIQVGNLFGALNTNPNETQIKGRVHALAQYLNHVGGFITLVAHNSLMEGDYTQQEWIWVMDALKESGIQVLPYGEAIEGIIQDAESTSGSDGSLHYLRSQLHLGDQSDYSLSPLSVGIDAGSNLSLTADFLGNPVYGSPDLGAFEFQPNYLIGDDQIDITAGAKIYADGKFRNLGTSSGNIADLVVKPEGGNFSTYGQNETRPVWLEIENIVWSNTGTRHKQWVENSDFPGLTNTLHVVGDLLPSKLYNVKVDSVLGQNITGDACTSGVCRSDSNGQITFTYTGTYSAHTFDIEEGDNFGPQIVSVTAENQDGYYYAGDTLNILVEFSENVAVAGIPRLQMRTNNGDKYANYYSGSNSSVLVFNYLVEIGDRTDDLDYSNVDSLDLNSGTIRDSVGNDAVLLLPLPGQQYSLGFNKTIIIDQEQPVVTDVTSISSNGTYKVGQAIIIRLIASETVIVSGKPKLQLDTNNGDRFAIYSQGSGSPNIDFSFEVDVNDSTERLNYVDINSLGMNGGSIVDLAGNPLVAILPSPSGPNSLAHYAKIFIAKTTNDFNSQGTQDDGQSISSINSEKIVTPKTIDDNLEVAENENTELAQKDTDRSNGQKESAINEVNAKKTPFNTIALIIILGIAISAISFSALSKLKPRK